MCEIHTLCRRTTKVNFTYLCYTRVEFYELELFRCGCGRLLSSHEHLNKEKVHSVEEFLGPTTVTLQNELKAAKGVIQKEKLASFIQVNGEVGNPSCVSTRLHKNREMHDHG